MSARPALDRGLVPPFLGRAGLNWMLTALAVAALSAAPLARLFDAWEGDGSVRLGPQADPTGVVPQAAPKPAAPSVQAAPPPPAASWPAAGARPAVAKGSALKAARRARSAPTARPKASAVSSAPAYSAQTGTALATPSAPVDLQNDVREMIKAHPELW